MKHGKSDTDELVDERETENVKAERNECKSEGTWGASCMSDIVNRRRQGRRADSLMPDQVTVYQRRERGIYCRTTSRAVNIKVQPGESRRHRANQVEDI